MHGEIDPSVSRIALHYIRIIVGRFSNRGLATIDITQVVRGAGFVLQRLGVGQSAACLRPALLPVLGS